MILLKPFLFALFVIFVWTRDDLHKKHAQKGEEILRRYSRDANLDIGDIKQKLFKRVHVYGTPSKVLQETKKLGTKVECAGLCLATPNCFGFQWIPSGSIDEVHSCQLLEKQIFCQVHDHPTTEIYVGEDESIPDCESCEEFNGIFGTSYGDRICCAKSCGQCGGSGCSQRPGGAEVCCASSFLKVVNRVCGVRDQKAPCKLKDLGHEDLHLAPPGSHKCDYGESVSKGGCEARGKVFMPNGPGGIAIGSGGSCLDGGWGQVPLGCSLQTVSNSDGKPHYKTSGDTGKGCIGNAYQLICKVSADSS